MGTLKIKGDSTSLCYWNAHEKSKEPSLATGAQREISSMSMRRVITGITARTDDMLKVSGIFVAPGKWRIASAA